MERVPGVTQNKKNGLFEVRYCNKYYGHFVDRDEAIERRAEVEQYHEAGKPGRPQGIKKPKEKLEHVEYCIYARAKKLHVYIYLNGKTKHVASFKHSEIQKARMARDAAIRSRNIEKNLKSEKKHRILKPRELVNKPKKQKTKTEPVQKSTPVYSEIIVSNIPTAKETDMPNRAFYDFNTKTFSAAVNGKLYEGLKSPEEAQGIVKRGYPVTVRP
jgi:hypothetical protein